VIEVFGRYIKAMKAGLIASAAIVILQLAEQVLWQGYTMGRIGAVGMLSIAIFPLLVLTASLSGAICVRMYHEQLRRAEVNIIVISAIPGFIAGIVSMLLGYLLDLALPLFSNGQYMPSASVCIVFTAPVTMTVLAVAGGLIYQAVYADKCKTETQENK
jgi:uncharacterized protein YacL